MVRMMRYCAMNADASTVRTDTGVANQFCRVTSIVNRSFRLVVHPYEHGLLDGPIIKKMKEATCQPSVKISPDTTKVVPV